MKQRTLSAAKYRSAASEHDLQAQALEYIRLKARPGIFAFAIPNAAKRSLRTAARLKREGMMSGVADVCVLLDNGRTGWLEFKTAKGRQSVAQQNFEARCLNLAHQYELCRDLDDVIAVLWRWGAVR